MEKAFKMSKTQRRRGAIYALIRSVAANRKLISPDNLVPPLTITQACTNLSNLRNRGELFRVKMEPVSRNGVLYMQSVYSRANLRPANLTNRHL